MLRKAIFAALLLCNYPSILAHAQTQLSIYGGWGAYVSNVSSGKLCNAISWADQTSPENMTKGKLMVNATVPPEGYDSITYLFGFQHDSSVIPLLTIGTNSYPLSIVLHGLPSMAYISPDLDHQIVSELRSFNRPVVVAGKATTGVNVSYSHSLTGFNEAYNRALEECGFSKLAIPHIVAQAPQPQTHAATPSQQPTPQWPTPPVPERRLEALLDDLFHTDRVFDIKLSTPTNPLRDGAVFLAAILVGGLFGFKRALVRHRLVFIFIAIPIFCCWSYAVLTFFEWILIGGIPLRDVFAPLILAPLTDPIIVRLWLVSCLMFLLASIVAPFVATLAADHRATLWSFFPKTEAETRPPPQEEPAVPEIRVEDEPAPTVTNVQSLPAVIESMPVEEVLPPSQPMLLRLKRTQRQGPMGGNIYMLDARLDVSAEIRDLINKHRWGPRVIYESEARQKHAAKTQSHLEGTKSDVGLFAPPSAQAMGAAKSIWKLARAGVSAARMAFSLRVTVNSILAGVHVECKGMEELLEAENAFRKAKETLEGYVAAAQSFDGREEIA